MKTKVLYTIINILSLLSGIASAGIVAIIVANMVGAAERGRSGELTRVFFILFRTLFPTLFGLLVVTTVLYAIWDIGTRLIRMEQAQASMLREIHNKQDSVV